MIANTIQYKEKGIQKVSTDSTLIFAEGSARTL